MLYTILIDVTDYPVENFRGEGLSSTKLELFWDPPTEGSYNHYVISYTIKGDKHRRKYADTGVECVCY